MNQCAYPGAASRTRWSRPQILSASTDGVRRLGLVAIAATFPVLFSACVARPIYDKAAGQIEMQDGVISSLKEENILLAEENQTLREKLEMTSAEAQRASKEGELAKGALSELETRLSELETFPTEIQDYGGGDLPEGVSVYRTAEGISFSVADTILFDTGKTTIKKAGQSTLRSLVDRFRNTVNRIRVEGHSDNVPIVQPATIKKYPRGNLELSGQRALLVADFLVKNGVDANRISYAGYGEHRPVSTNDAPDGRRKNRRVDILVIDET